MLKNMQPYFNDGFESVWYTEGKAEFANSRAAMIIGGSADAATKLVAWLASKGAQQQVANLIALPVAKGVSSTADRVAKEMVDAGQANIPVWLDVPTASGVFEIFVKEGGGLFNGRLSPDDLAKLLQPGITA